ncbi:ATP-binding protein [Streptomyces sp. NPDC050704]|uniref:ATP-binding protein n=1 Tax=Streptomyces sp. NPDC050704 TaxID=3157219 RepID=UPI003425F2A0
MTDHQTPAPSRMLFDRDADIQLQMTTLEGWRDFVADAPAPPHRLTSAQLKRLTEPERKEDQAVRLDYHARTHVVDTPTIRNAVLQGRLQILMNRHEHGARHGLLVSGPAGTGKSIAIAQLGKSHELDDQVQHPGVTDRIPALYVTVPPAATARMIASEFARFLGLPVRTRLNMTDIIESVVGVLIDARCTLVLVDEVHNISLATRTGAEVSDTLKYFAERIPATFVYAGINLEHGGLLEGTRGTQIAGRFTPIRTTAFPRGPVWKGLVKTFEDNLWLHRLKPGSLLNLSDWLHAHTGGMIGVLSHVIRGAALAAILSNTETITRAGIEAIPLPVAAEADRHLRMSQAKVQQP